MSSSFAISSQLTYARIRGLMDYFHEAAARHNLPVSLLLAIASRESSMGLSLDANWAGDNGNGIGIMQIDRRYHPDFTGRHANADHQANIHYGAQYLAGLIRQFSGDLGSAVAAYNAGPTRVRSALSSGLPADAVTTGRDYSADVLRRKALIESLNGRPEPARLFIAFISLSVAGFATYKFLTLNS